MRGKRVSKTMGKAGPVVFILAGIAAALLLSMAGARAPVVVTQNTAVPSAAQPTPSAIATPAPSVTAVPSVMPGEQRFDNAGYLARNNPGFEQGVWYLVYEQQSLPALYAKLRFTAQSVCAMSGASDTPCLDVAFVRGTRVRVRGVVTDPQTIQVGRMEELPEGSQ